MATKKPEDAAGSPASVTYRDKRYAQRSVFTDSMRSLQVLRGRIEVKADDAEALAYLDQHADFERLE